MTVICVMSGGYVHCFHKPISMGVLGINTLYMTFLPLLFIQAAMVGKGLNSDHYRTAMVGKGLKSDHYRTAMVGKGLKSDHYRTARFHCTV